MNDPYKNMYSENAPGELPVESITWSKELSGLSEEEATARLASEGPNELPSQKKRNLLTIGFEVVREPMFILLIAAGSIYLCMGEAVDALMLLGFVFVVMAITIIQERRTEKALDALRDLSSPRALVVRGGVSRRIPGREVVKGDIVVLAEGDRVPADGFLRSGINLSADESLLTGESVPVRKTPSVLNLELEKPGGDDLSTVFSGTLITAGQGVMEVAATGLRSELGKIGKALLKVVPEPTLLQKETGKLVRVFACLGIFACAVVVVVFALTRGGGPEVWKQGFLAGIAMAMATLPEEFPVVLMVFLALGAWRISKSNVLTRRMPAVETLGAATVLCVDKTGTLTQNRMTLKALRAGGDTFDLESARDDLPENIRILLENAILASKPGAFDPMEKAIHESGGKFLQNTRAVGNPGELIREYPLSPELLAVSHAWIIEENRIIVASKGAPEAVASLCCLSCEQTEHMLRDVSSLASKGLRVLGVARGELEGSDLPENHSDLSLKFSGLIGFIDPLRPAVPGAISECRTAGVRVVMITGDYPETALAIARQAGLGACGKVISGFDLDGMTDDELSSRIPDVEVFARVVPEQKLRIVNAFKSNGEIVAMTGDGVNDAPALKSAHIGIAMGGRGTDVARESASLVLLDDDFSSIVAAIRLGRRIYDNIKKAVAFILSVHVPIAGLSMIPVFLGDWPLLLFPVHIVFLELIIDPACTLIFEAEKAETGLMQRPPRKSDEKLFSMGTVGIALLQGLSVLAVCLGAFVIARIGHSDDTARALTFSTLVAAFIAIILVNRSWTRSVFSMLREKNTALLWVIIGAVSFLAAVLALPFAQKLFHFGPIHPEDLGFGLAAGLICVLWFEFMKLFKRLKRGKN